MSSRAETEASARKNEQPSRFVLVAFLDETTIPLELPATGSLTIGRASACEFTIDHPSVSREHARLHVGATITIEDLGSRNGTLVRGVPLAPNTPTPLRPGDVVECGDATLVLRGIGATPPKTTSSAPPSRAVFVVGAGGHTLSVAGGEPVNLGRRGALRRVLLELAQRRLAAPGAGLGVAALLDAGWPGEKMSWDAGVARVYTTIQRLRALGLQSVLLTRDDGYLLDPNAAIRIEE